MNMNHHSLIREHGPGPFCVDISCAAETNPNFRTALWTGTHLQTTLMHIPVHGDIGVEIHPETDQLVRVEAGQAQVRMGPCRDQLRISCCLTQGHAVFIPCGTWHNIYNVGSCPLKLSSVYAPPHHPAGTVHKTRADAEE